MKTKPIRLNNSRTKSLKSGRRIIKGSKKDMVLKLIALRRSTAQRERDDAIEKHEWSKVPGYDGIDIGLMIAEKIIREEL